MNKYFSVLWIVLMALTSSINDMFTRLASDVPTVQLAFLRFALSGIVLFPWLLRKDWKLFLRIDHGRHIWRTILGTLGMISAVCAAQTIPLPQVTLIFYTVPLFGLLLANIFLKEKIGPEKSIAAIIGFTGAAIASDLDFANIFTTSSSIYILIPFLGAFLFALSDVMIKNMVSNHNDDKTFMLFHFSLGTSLLSIMPAILVWQPITITHLIYAVCLGIGGNLIQWFLFMAFSKSDISSLTSFRYVEVIFSVFISFIMFDYVPTLNLFIGAFMIISSSLFLNFLDQKKTKKHDTSVVGV